MSKVTCDMSMSVDGFVAGPNQSLANPFGEGVGDRLHRWMFEWDLEWKGWWGDEPPYHGPVFVLTHHPRPTLVLDAGTTRWLSYTADAGAAAQSQAQRRTLNSQPHNVAPDAIAPALEEFFAG